MSSFPQVITAGVNERDALGYLDQVKTTFADKPGTYNEFLDVMREFKTGHLSTDQVVSRVSLLFKDHQNLMDGFHNFLPQGRVSSSGVVPSLNGISTPMLMAQNYPVQGDIGSRISASMPQLSPTPQSRNTPISHPTHISLSGASAHDTIQTSVTPGAASVLNAGGQKGAVEFNHAINYVNKIKTRYAHDAKTYKEFLEILQTYQKDAKPIQEVYHQVTILFADAPDLLAEFKQFLPDNSAPPQQGGSGSVPPSQKAGSSSKPEGPTRRQTGSKRQREEEDAILAPPPPKKRVRGTGAANAHAKKEKEKEEDIVPVKRSRSTRTAKAVKAQSPQPPVIEEQYAAPTIDDSYVPIQVPQLTQLQRLECLQHLQHSASIPRHLATVPLYEVSFFDDIKRSWDNKPKFQSFLRLLGLYNAKIIGLKDLMNRAYEFLGDSETHMEQFKEIVGWDVERREAGGGRIEGEEWYIENEDALERRKVDMGVRPRCGVSYRKLPHWEVDLVCTGRDGGDWSVLNDEWVGYPPATIPGDGPRGESSSHKMRLQSEEIIFGIEHERHIFSITIETNSRAMAYLRPILFRIQRMSQAEKDALRLPEDLGIPSPAIIKRNLQKIYGPGPTTEIFRSLSEQPGLTIPVVMARFTAKDEEWRKLQKEYSKMWRDTERQHHYKSLDPKGVTIKKEDSKALKPACLAYEIALLKKKKEKRRFDVDPKLPPIRSTAQIEFGMQKDVLLDSAELLQYFVQHTSTAAKSDKLKMQKNLRRLLVLFFQIPQEEVDTRVRAPEEDEDGDNSMEKDDEESAAEQLPSPCKRSKKRSKGSDEESVLSSPSLQSDRAEASAQRAKGATTENGDSELKETSRMDNLNWDSVSWDASYERRWTFFGDANFYQFFRIFQVLYHRLNAMKWVCEEKKKKNVPRLSSLAIELAFATKVEGIDDGYDDYYRHMLKLCRDHINGQTDTAFFEESMRWMFGIRAFPIYSVVIICQAASKVMFSLDNDQTSIDIFRIFERDRSQISSTLKDQVRYRVEAEDCLEGNGKLYRIEWHPQVEIVTIGIVDKRTNSQGQTDLARYMRDECAPSSSNNHHLAGPVTTRQNVHDAQTNT